MNRKPSARRWCVFPLAAALAASAFSCARADREGPAPQAQAAPEPTPAPAPPPQTEPGGVTLMSGQRPAEAASAQQAQQAASGRPATPQRRRARIRLAYEERESRHAIVQGSVLRVEPGKGDVHVMTGTAGEMVVRAEIGASDAERLAGTALTVETGADGAAVVAVRWPETRADAEYATLWIEVPAGALRAVDVRTASGFVTLSGLSGDAAVETSTGDVAVQDQAGSVRVTTTNGRVTVERPGGAVEAQTSNAMVVVREAPGSVVVRNSTGAVGVHMASSALGPLDVRTTLGAVSLDVGPGFAGEVRLDAPGGEAAVAQGTQAEVERRGPASATVRFPRAGAPSAVSTTNASVLLRQRGG